MKREGLALSTNRFIGTSTTAGADTTPATSSANAGVSPVSDAAVMAAVDWRNRRRWPERVLTRPSAGMSTEGFGTPKAAAKWAVAEQANAATSSRGIMIGRVGAELRAALGWGIDAAERGE